MSANAGGTILQGYDLFKQLFPSILPYGATRFRAHEVSQGSLFVDRQSHANSFRKAFNIVGEEISYYCGLVPRKLGLNRTVENREASAWNYRTDVDINYNNFKSWPEKYGHYAYGPKPDYYTSIIRWNLRSVDSRTLSTITF